MLAVVLQGRYTLEAGEGIGVTAGADALFGEQIAKRLYAHTAGQHQNGVCLTDGALLLQAELQILHIANIVGYQGADNDALRLQIFDQLVGFLLGEMDLLSAVADENEDLAL